MIGNKVAIVVPSTWKVRTRATALNKGQGDIAEAATATNDLLRRAFDLSDDGFINLDNLARAAKWRKIARLHRFPNSVAEKPSGFHAARKHPLNLAGRNAFLGRAHKVNDLQPKVQRQM
jgi:hypothetical protein